jgi:hypothetical protein
LVFGYLKESVQQQQMGPVAIGGARVTDRIEQSNTPRPQPEIVTPGQLQRDLSGSKGNARDIYVELIDQLCVHPSTGEEAKLTAQQPNWRVREFASQVKVDIVHVWQLGELGGTKIVKWRQRKFTAANSHCHRAETLSDSSITRVIRESTRTNESPRTRNVVDDVVAQRAINK